MGHQALLYIRRDPKRAEIRSVEAVGAWAARGDAAGQAIPESALKNVARNGVGSAPTEEHVALCAVHELRDRQEKPIRARGV